MDVLVCAEPGKLQLANYPAPHPAPGEALVRPRRVGICGTDYHIFEGKHPFLAYPRVMGHELAVEVVEATEESGFAPGDVCVVNPYLSCGECIACRAGKPNCCARISVLGVHQDGGMAQLLSVPVTNLICARELSLDECATVEFLAIGAHAVRRGAVRKCDRVLVVGAGPIGLGVALFAGNAGGDVAILELDEERASSAEQLTGARAIHVNGAIKDAVLAHTGGEGFDVVFDATGNPHAMQASFDYVGHGGRLVFVSVVTNDITFADPLFHSREMTLLGSRNATNEDFSNVMAAIQSGSIPTRKLITHRTSLGKATIDLPFWAEQKSGLIKAVIELE